MRFIASILLAFTTLVSSLPAENLPKVKVSNLRRVFHNGEHNAFTDLIRFGDHLYLTFRSCPDGHMVYPTASVMVMRSSDEGKTWQEVHRFSVKDRETRDPHFLVFQNRLIIYTGTWWSGPTTIPVKDYDMNKMQGYAVWTENGSTWSQPEMLEGTFGHYIWRAATFDGKVYLCARRKLGFNIPAKGEGEKIQALMLESDDGIIFKKRAYFTETAGDETAFLFEKDGSILAIGRHGGGKSARVYRSSIPYTHWEREDLGQAIGGPLVVKWGNRTVVGGRKTTPEKGPKTSLGWLNGNSLNEFAELPSGGDNSYPGLVELSPQRALLSYYSSHEKDENGKPISAIYMAELEVEE